MNAVQYQTGTPMEIAVDVDAEHLTHAATGREAKINQIGDLRREARQLIADGFGPVYEVEVGAYNDEGYGVTWNGGLMLWTPHAPGNTAGLWWGGDSDWYDATSPDDAVRQSQEAEGLPE